MSSHARAILEAKLALEQEVQRPILTLCTRYVEVWVQAQSRIPTGDRMLAQASLEQILLRHYARVVMVMSGRKPPREAQLHVAVRSLHHMESLRARAKYQAKLILNTLDRDLARGMAEGSSENPINDGTTNYGKGFGDIEVKAERVVNVRAGYIGKLRETAASTLQKLKGKLGVISNVNTNPVAEQSRDLEILIVPQNQANGHIEKTWNSLMDGRERPTHHEAHLQTVPVTEPFEVGDSQLRFPGDSELGAPLSEICNCRCFLTHHFVSDEDGSRTLIHTAPSAPTRRYAPLGPGKPSVMRPTSLIRLNGRTSARVVLGDGETFATMRQPTPNTVEVLVNRRVVARASILNGRAINIQVDAGMSNQGIDGLITRSVEHSAAHAR